MSFTFLHLVRKLLLDRLLSKVPVKFKFDVPESEKSDVLVSKNKFLIWHQDSLPCDLLTCSAVGRHC